MSRKKDKDRGRYVASPETVRRHLKKGNFREALKDAKLCFRTEASEANRTLLEEAFLDRVEQLHRDKQPADAKAVLADLMAMGPKSSKVLENVARLRVLLGEMGAGSNAALQSNPALVIEIADNAVLNQNAVIPNFADLPQHVNAVRQALLSVEQGDDKQALDHLAIISRGSPLADWRLFIRGLSAFYNRDDERAESNWTRLEQHRPAARIARTLKLAARMPGSAEAVSDIHVEDGARRLVNSLANPISTLLTQLADAWKNPNKRSFFRIARQLQQKYGESHEKVVRQIVEVVWKWAVRNASGRVLNELTAIGPPPEFDPQWNRCKALLAEHPEDSSSLADIESLWVFYTVDVSHLEFLSVADRAIASGLVFQHLADKFRDEADMLETEMRENGDLDDDEDDDDVAFLVRKAIQFYQEGIQSCPRLEACYLSIVKLNERYGEIDSAAKVMEELVKSDPDSFAAAIWLASYHLSKDNPGKAGAYVSTARRLRPRDPQLAPLLWNQKLTMARGLVLNRQFEAARQEINEATGLTPADNDPCTLDLFLAGLELKAGNSAGAEQHIAAAQEKVDAPAFVWMQMSSLAAVFRLPRDVRKKFDDRLSGEITKELTSDTAGLIARFLNRMRATQTAYVGRAGHERLFLRHLTQSKKITWQPDDLKSLCEVLSYFPVQKKFRRELLDLGVAKHRAVPQFAYWAGLEELNSVRTAARELRLEELFSAAISTHNAGPRKLTEKELEFAMSTVSSIREMIEERQKFSQFSGFYDDDDDADEYEFWDEEMDDDAEAGDFEMPPGMMGLEDYFNAERPDKGLEIDDETFKSIERAMPPIVRRQLGEVAKVLGMTVKEATIKLFLKAMEETERAGADHSRRGKPSGRSGNSNRTPF